ncbi:MAG: hypothetical protein SFV54_04445 [Bryobacteraceae bacterium]|nr:hypothetical protein [Bryobacteraceae bacterium]
MDEREDEKLDTEGGVPDYDDSGGLNRETDQRQNLPGQVNVGGGLSSGAEEHHNPNRKHHQLAEERAGSGSPEGEGTGGYGGSDDVESGSAKPLPEAERHHREKKSE